MKKSNIKVVEIEVVEDAIITVTYESGAKRYYTEQYIPQNVIAFMAEHIDNTVRTERNNHVTITYSEDNTLNKTLESTRVYDNVYFGGVKINVDMILKNLLAREDVNIVYSTACESYKVFYNNKKHHVYHSSALERAIKELKLIVAHV